MLILSAPSGCGKTTILNRLLKRHSKWQRSVSVTTRPPRLDERRGKDYDFVTPGQFQSLKRRKQLLEWAKVFGQYYGTRKSVIEAGVQKGDVVLLAIDVQGHRKVRRAVKGKMSFFSIFILPPSISALRERLENRKTDSAEEIEKRIQVAQEEIKLATEYDATVINRDLDQTTHEIEALIDGFEKKAFKEGGK